MPSTSIKILCIGNALLVASIIFVGAITRLTESGLSITEWELFKGVWFPSSTLEWQQYFDLYKQSSEYKLINHAMSLNEFQSIFWWEYIHRLIGRSFIITYALPLLILYIYTRRKGLDWNKYCGTQPKLLLVVLALGALQGFIGWWMVASGLVNRVDVSPIRLAIHLGMAWIIFSILVWIGTTSLRPKILISNWNKIITTISLVVLYIVIILGALTAGFNGGFADAHWPLYENGSLIPNNFSLTETVSIQSLHRNAAYIAGIWLILSSIYGIYKGLWTSFGLVIIATVSLQILLGVLTLTFAVPIALGLAHQATALFLWTLLLTRLKQYITGY